MDQNIARVIRAATSNAESNANPACFYANAKKRFGLDDGKKVKATSSSMENSKFGNDDDLFFDDDAEEEMKRRREEGATVDEKKAFTRKRKSRVVGSGSGGANEIASVADDDHCVRFKMRAEKTNEDEEEEKLEDTNTGTNPKLPPPSMTTTTTMAEKKKKTTHKQMYLDLGQKSFTHVNCPTCGLMYAKGEPSDEELHRKHHTKFLDQRDNAFVMVNTSAVNSFWFDERKKNWREVEIRRKEASLASSEKCRIYRVTKGGCDRHAWAKMKRVARTVEAEIGAVDDWILGEEDGAADLRIVAFVCVSFNGTKTNEGKIVGAAFCEDIASNQREVFASETAGESENGKDSSDKVRCGGVLKKGSRIKLSSQTRDSLGIRALWVHKNFRRAGICYSLLENCRRRFYGDASMIGSSTIVEKDKVAFSQPTYQGELFIAKYAGNDGKFLVYE